MTLRWHPDAIAEAAAAARFYGEVDPGIRKFRPSRFPYALVFRDGQELQILAVMHVRRDPGYWRERM